MDADDLDDCMDGVGAYAVMHEEGSNASLYYFGNNEDEDGALKTGATTVTLDGDTYSFYFNKSGGAESKGKGLTGIDDGKYIYKFGMKIKADSDDKYKVVYASGDVGDEAIVEEVDSAKLRSAAEKAGQNKDEDTVKYFGTLDGDYYLVNTSGSIVKNKTAAKDGDDWYFYVDEKQIKMYTNSKTLTVDSGEEDLEDESNNVLKDDWDDTDVTIKHTEDTITLSAIADRDGATEATADAE